VLAPAVHDGAVSKSKVRFVPSSAVPHELSAEQFNRPATRPGVSLQCRFLPVEEAADVLCEDLGQPG
jgi:hypothetical protein